MSDGAGSVPPPLAWSGFDAALVLPGAWPEGSPETVPLSAALARFVRRGARWVGPEVRRDCTECHHQVPRGGGEMERKRFVGRGARRLALAGLIVGIGGVLASTASAARTASS